MGEYSREMLRRQYHGLSRETSTSSKTEYSTSSPMAKLSSKLTSRAPETSRARTSWLNWGQELLVLPLSPLAMPSHLQIEQTLLRSTLPYHSMVSTSPATPRDTTSMANDLKLL